MISQIIKFIRVISSEASPMQISFGVALGMIAGLTPLMSVHNIAVLFCLLFFRINLASFLISLPLFSLLAYLLDPLFHEIGLFILKEQSLLSTWTELYNSSFWRVARFNNTIVMGSLATSLAAFIPFVLLMNVLVKRYRSHVYVALKNSRMFKIMTSSKMLSRIVSVSE